jgi:hypothetical protein
MQTGFVLDNVSNAYKRKLTHLGVCNNSGGWNRRECVGYLHAIDVPIGQHHGGVVLVEGMATDGADETRVGAVCKWQCMGKVIEVTAAHRAVAVALHRVLLVAMAGAKVKVKHLSTKLGHPVN